LQFVVSKSKNDAAAAPNFWTEERCIVVSSGQVRLGF